MTRSSSPTPYDSETLSDECFPLAQPSSRSLVLDVGEDRLVLTARPSLFHLDVFHAFVVDQANSVAQFNRSTQVRSVNHTMTCREQTGPRTVSVSFTDPDSHYACSVLMNALS